MRQSSRRFWDRIARRYARRPVADESAYQKKLEITREYLQPDMEVFEFGCGTGSTAIAHAPFVKKILAIDISPNMIEIARGKALAQHVDNVTFEVATIDEFDPAAQSFDAVLALSILHLLDDRRAAVTTVHGLLKPGGVFVSSTACLGDTMRFLGPFLATGRVLGLLPLVRIFSRKELRDTLIACGFQIEHEWQPKAGAAVFIVARKSAG